MHIGTVFGGGVVLQWCIAPDVYRNCLGGVAVCQWQTLAEVLEKVLGDKLATFTLF